MNRESFHNAAIRERRHPPGAALWPILVLAVWAFWVMEPVAARADDFADAWRVRAEERLSSALAQYEGLAATGGWPRVPDGPTLKPGMVDVRVSALRQRLEITGDLLPMSDPTNVFDPALEAGVRAFQARHGLFVDGLVGRETLAALNVPVEKRVDTLRINLPRLQAFRPWQPSYLLVNIPGFEARVVRGPETVLHTRVIVGEPDWQTPQLNGMISQVEINPYWNVPKNILVKEIIPQVKRDPDYLQRQNLRVFGGWGANAPELDPATIDWNSRAVRGYRIRQDRGPKNALGHLKFMFPNPYSIYLHDTPSRGLFARAQRGLSHGCVRVQQPFDLAVLLLEGQGGWDEGALQAAISSGRNKVIALERPFSVHLVYWTAWVDEDDRVHFRPDLYERDYLPSNTLPLDPAVSTSKSLAG